MSAKLEFTRGEVIADKYEVVDVLDESPLGITYRTKHLKTGQYVRLQMLRPKVAGREQKDRILEIFKKSKALENPHLVKYGELGDHGGVAWVTWEDFEGGTLRELLQEYKTGGKQLALKEAAQICIQILEGLHELHQSGVVVRALRPEYILVSVRHAGPRKQTFVAQTKITNGLFWDLVPTAAIAEDEFTRGEAQYLAPELKSFEPHATPRSDVYSVAAMFYELLCGVPPVGTYQDPKKIREELPDHVNTVTELGLASSPDDRYPSAVDFIADLSRTFQDVNLEEGRVGRFAAIVVPLVAFGLAGLFVLFVAVILFFWRTDPALEAEAADSQLRKEVLDKVAAAQPSPEEYKAMLAKHPQNMAWVPAGPFVRGRLHQDPAAAPNEPLGEVAETKGFLVDLFEFPNLKGSAPVYSVTWEDAKQKCESVGKRLCTADEWERACKGPRTNLYSYGDTYDEEFCGKGLEEVYASGSKALCKSEWGPFDLSGSFREWTATEQKKGRMLVKGGQKGNPEAGTRCAASSDESVNYADRTLAFRCCRDEDAPPPPPAPEPPPEAPAPTEPAPAPAP